MLYKILQWYVFVLMLIYHHLYAHNPKVLILFRASSITGGGLTYKFNFYKSLIKSGIDAQFLLIASKHLNNFLEENNVAFHECNKKNLLATLLFLCATQKFTVLHTNNTLETDAAKRIRSHMPHLKIIRTLHGENYEEHNTEFEALRDIDGVITVGASVASVVQKLNQEEHYNIKQIAFIPPFFDEEKFNDVRPRKKSYKNFFYHMWNIHLNNKYPIITSIAHFYPTSKNHSVLIKAVNVLIHQYEKKVYLMLAGEGSKKDDAKALVEKLGLSEYVHFLGWVESTDIPELLWHSTINALTSDKEGAGIALLEGAMLQKPLIGTRGTGMEFIIKHGHTGLLFEKNNEHDLAAQLSNLLDYPRYANRLGQQAYSYSKKYLSNDANIQKYLNVVNAISC